MTGVPPGTELVRVKETGNIIRVRKGDIEFDAKRQDLTNDLDIVERVGRADALSQSMTDEGVRKERNADTARKLEEQSVTGGSVQIFQATYGVGNVIWDITERVRQKVLNGGTTITASNALAGGDPVVGRVKTMYISYSIGSGPQAVELREGESINFPVRPAHAIQPPLGGATKLDRGPYDQKNNVSRAPRIPHFIDKRPSRP